MEDCEVRVMRVMKAPTCHVKSPLMTQPVMSPLVRPSCHVVPPCDPPMTLFVQGDVVRLTDPLTDPTLQCLSRAMAAEGAPFKGTLFAGLMIKDGKAKLLEHNVRYGDPECQSLMARLDSDLADAMILARCENSTLTNPWLHALAWKCG